MLSTLLSLFRTPLFVHWASPPRVAFDVASVEARLISKRPTEGWSEPPSMERKVRNYGTRHRICFFSASMASIPSNRCLSSFKIRGAKSAVPVYINRLPFERFDGPKQPPCVGPDRQFHLPTPRLLVHDHWKIGRTIRVEVVGASSKFLSLSSTWTRLGLCGGGQRCPFRDWLVGSARAMVLAGRLRSRSSR